jgi:alkanesulfonate monooxygenase SsuD/methylene tetrahydromethanopterin reductase-like flavin-dependent oxidoreductase (luciferase family)
MQIGIGLPAPIPGTKGDVILEWARKADAAGFSSLGIIDRLVFPNYESLIALAAAAGATTRIRLMTTVLLAPLRNTALLAKQAASLDALSNGRLTLGLGVGAREDDFQAAGVSFSRRGQRFEEQLVTMKRIWAGEPVVEGLAPIGPKPVQPGGPELLIGAYAPRAVERAARHADGFIAGGGGPERAKQGYEITENAWKAAGREGKPRFVCATYFGLGDVERAGEYLRTYYAGPMGETIAKAVLSTPEAVKDAIQAFASIGADELILWPTIADQDQVDRLAEAAF